MNIYISTYLHIYISTYLAHDTRLLLLSYPRCWHQLVATPLPPPPTPTITPIVVGAVWGDATHITTHSTTSWRWYMVLFWDLDIQGVYKRTGISRIRDVLEWCQSVNVLFLGLLYKKSDCVMILDGWSPKKKLTFSQVNLAACSRSFAQQSLWTYNMYKKIFESSQRAWQQY